MTDGHVAFLVAGVQKSGTSALHDYLGDVPGLQLPGIKEAHFFDDEPVDWAALDTAPYHRLFAEDGRMWGEATPIYIYWPGALERIRAYNPAMRLVLLFRDPIERAWSHWKMEWAKRKETEPFAWCIREGRARLADAEPPGVHRVWSYVERGFYGSQLARALALFPREQILCLPHALLDRDPDEAVRRVCAHLGTAPPAAPLRPRRIRVARDVAYPSRLAADDVDLLRGIYAREIAQFRDLVGSGEDWSFRYV